MKRLAALLAVIVLGASCGSTPSTPNDTEGTNPSGPVTLTLLTHDSFTYPEGIFDAFTAATGVKVEVVLSGDAGELVTKAVLKIGRAHV